MKRRRAAFTLVELLVVMAICAVLMTLVLTGARPSQRGQVKQAAQSLASVLLGAQSRALGKPAGAAIVLESSGVFSATVADAFPPPLIEGGVTSGMPPAQLDAAFATVSLTPFNGVTDLSQGYKIQFVLPGAATAVSPWMAFDPASSKVSFRGADAQTTQNTIWPQSQSGLNARIACYPTSRQAAYTFPKAAAIDLRYSGVGEDPPWGRLDAAGPIVLAYGMIGEVDALMKINSRTDLPITPVSPVYLLVASTDDIEANTSLVKATSLWVVVQPQTGRVTISSNVPQTGTDATALRAARASARAGLPIGK